MRGILIFASKRDPENGWNQANLFAAQLRLEFPTMAVTVLDRLKTTPEIIERVVELGIVCTPTVIVVRSDGSLALRKARTLPTIEDVRAALATRSNDRSESSV